MPRTQVLAGAVASALAVAANAQLTIVKTIPGQFTDISGTGNFVDLGDEDEAGFISTVGNGVFPAGIVIIGNNGGLGFNPPAFDLGPIPMPLPSPAAFGGGQALLPYWADIGNHTGAIHWQEINNVLIVQWTNKRSKVTGATNTFQIKVFGGVAFLCTGVYAQMIYQDIQDPDFFGGANASIGYQDNGPNTVQWSFMIPMSVQNNTVLSLVCEGTHFCPADFNGDGFVTGDDYDAFVSAFENGDPAADFNHDGFVTGDDFDEFVAAFLNGC